MFSRLLDHHRRLVNGMYFQTSPERIADRAASKAALTILSGFIAGQEHARDAQDALICLVILYGDPVKVPARQFWRAMTLDDADARAGVFRQSFDQIERQVSR